MGFGGLVECILQKIKTLELENKDRRWLFSYETILIVNNIDFIIVNFVIPSKIAKIYFLLGEIFRGWIR